MANKPHSEALRETIATLDASISEAKQLHDSAVIARREAIAVNIAIIANSGASEFFDAGDIVVPDTTSTSARVQDLLQKREVAAEMLDRAIESERLAKQRADRATLNGFLGKQSDEAAQIDATFVALVNLITSYGQTCDQVHRHMRHAMQLAVTPGTPTDDVAKSLGAAIARAVHWNAAQVEPVATPRADKFARRARSEAGMA